MVALKPRGPLTATPAALKSALSTFPPTITSLDLRRSIVSLRVRHSPDQHPINAATLAAIPAAFPNLQELFLPPMPPALAPAALAVLQASPHLTSFHTSLCNVHVPDTNPPALWAPLLQPPIAPRVTRLTVPESAFAPIATTPPGTFPLLTKLTVTRASLRPLPVEHRARMRTAAPQFCTLVMDEHYDKDNGASWEEGESPPDFDAFFDDDDCY